MVSTTEGHLFVDQSPASQAALLVADVVSANVHVDKITDQNASKLSEISPDGKFPALKVTDGSVLVEPNTIARHIIAQSADAAALLGDTPLEQAEVAQWLSFTNTDVVPAAVSGQLAAPMDALDRFLITRVFLVANRLTLADIILYAALHAPLLAVAEAERGKSSVNVWRWVNHIQHLPKIRAAPHALPVISLNTRTAYAAPKAKPAAAAAAPSVPNGHAAPAPPQPAAPPAKQRAQAPAATSAAPAAAAAGSSTKAEKAPKKSADGAKPPETSGTDGGQKAAAGAAEGKKKAAKDKDKDGAEKPAKTKAAAAPAPPAAPEQSDISKLNIRVGKILKAWKHPDADSLYVEEIDLGEEKPRTVVSGLVKYIPIEEMQNRRVVVLANLKPSAMRGIVSQAMVLAASNPDHTAVALLTPPDGAPIGERVIFEGADADPWGEPEAQLNPKKKVFEKVQPEFKTGPDGIAYYKSAAFKTAAGVVTAAICGGSIK